MVRKNLENLFFGVCCMLMLQCSSRVAPAPNVGDLYPTASRFATVLYATEVKARDGMKVIASHAEISGPIRMSWDKEISEAGEYEAVLSYSSWNNSPVIDIISAKDSLNDSLDQTHGVFDTAADWYYMNYERRLIKGTLNLEKGMNNISLSVVSGTDSAKLNIYSIELLPVSKKAEAENDIGLAVNARPPMDWFTQMKYGVMFHWTAQSAPRAGPHIPYKQAVADFNVNRFVEMVSSIGAGYVIFTGNHAQPHFPAPLAIWAKEYPGQTTDRDLIMEIASALKKKNIRFFLYLATHIYAKQEKVNSEEFDRINTALISEIGSHYKDKIDGFWLDGFYQSFQTHPSFDFEKFYKTAKTGNPSRLLTLNSWLYPVVSQWQDYWAGEVYTPSSLPPEKIILSGPGKGLSFQSLVVLENDWVHEKADTKIPPPRLKAEQLINYISSCSGKGPVTINIGIYQDGSIGEEAMAEMQKIKKGVAL